MLSKLLSNIENSENSSLPEGLSDKMKSADGKNGSQRLFHSLLKALQSDQSAEGNKQLLRLDNSNDETEGEKESDRVSLKDISETLTQTNPDETIVNHQQGAQSILERLRQQLKNVNSDSEKQNLSGEKTKESQSKNEEITVSKSQQKADGTDGSDKTTGQLKKALIEKPSTTDSKNQRNSSRSADEVSDNNKEQAKDSKKNLNATEVKSSFELSGDKTEETEKKGQTSNTSESNQKIAVKLSEKEQNYPQKEGAQKVDDSKGKHLLNRQQSEGSTGPLKREQIAVSGTSDQKEQNKQQSLNEPTGAKSVKSELDDRQKKVINSFFRNNNTVALSEKGFEIKSTVEKDRRKTRGNPENIEKGRSTNRNSESLLKRLGILNTENFKQGRSIDIQNIPGMSTGDSQMSTAEQKIWDAHTPESVEADEENDRKTSRTSSSVKLNQIPVMNASLRQKILPALTQSVQKAAAEAKKSPGSWKKHNFVLDDGKKIQLSVREAKGVLQVKMGSVNSDLSKLLQQNLQQIREHLKQEFGSDIDLQFEGHQQSGEESAFSEDSKSSGQQRDYRNALSENGLAAEDTGDVASSTVRNFGYNQMEWTA